jgi:subtilisin family serine protease
MTEPAAPATIVNDIWSAIQPETLWKGRTGKGVRVAVVDSGIDTEHPDLKGKVKESVEIVTVDGRLEFRPSTSGDQAGHGTACAGIIASVAPDVELYSVKVLGPQGSGSGEMFLVGLDYAIKQKFHVINLSLGTTKRVFCAGPRSSGSRLSGRMRNRGRRKQSSLPGYPSIFLHQWFPCEAGSDDPSTLLIVTAR